MPEDSSNISSAEANKEFEDALRELQAAKAEEEEARQRNIEVKKLHDEVDRKTNTLQKNILAITLKEKTISVTSENGKKVTALTEAFEKSINPNLQLLKDKKKDDPVLENFYETYRTFADLYSANLEKGSIPSDSTKVHAVAGAVVAMQQVLSQAHAYILNKENGGEGVIQSEPEMLADLQKVSYLGIDEKELKGIVTAPANLQKIKDDVSNRATKLFGKLEAPGLYRRIINANQYLPEDQRLLTLRDFAKEQAARYAAALVEKPKKQWKKSDVPEFELSNDPVLLGQAQDAVTWMELAGTTLEKYATPGSQVAAYLQDKLKPVEVTVAQTETPTTTIPTRTKESSKGTPKTIDTPQKIEKTPEPEVEVKEKLTPSQMEAAQWIIANGKSIMGEDGLTDDDLGMDASKKPRATEEMLALFIDHANTLGDIGANLKQGEEISSLQRIVDAQTQTKQAKNTTPAIKSVPESAVGKTRDNPTPIEKNTAVPQAIPTKSAEVQKPQREVTKGTVAEYFQKAGGIDRLNNRILGIFEKYNELIADKKEYGGSTKWQTYAQEAKQLSSRYSLTLSNGSWPTDEKNRMALLAVATEFEQLLADYAQDRERFSSNPPAVEDGPWKDEALQKLTPNERLKKFSDTYRQWSEEYGSAQGKTKEIWMAFDADYKPYYNIYQRTAEKKPVDMRMIAAILTQMERLVHYYEPKLQAAKETEQKPAEKESSVKSLFGGFLNKASAVVGDVVQQSSDDPEIQKKFMATMFKPGQSRFDIRQNLITGSTLKPLPKLGEKETESLLYLQAHLPDFAGKDGRLNANDVAAVVDSIYRDVMSRPHDLHKRILKEKNIPQGSYEDVGLQKALGLVAEMTAHEASQFNQGIDAENRPLMGWLFRTFRSDDYNRLQQAKMQLNRLYSVRAQIPAEVRATIDQQLKAFIQKAHLSSYVSKHDTGHGRLSEADMLAFEKHAAVLKAVSERALKDVRERTGANIETYLPDGLSNEFIDWMLDAQARPDGRKGTAPGSYFWIEGAPVASPSNRGPVASKEKKIEKVESAEMPSVDLGEPSADLGQPSMQKKLETKTDDGFVTIPSRSKSKSAAPQEEPVVDTTFDSPFQTVESENTEKKVATPEVQPQNRAYLAPTNRTIYIRAKNSTAFMLQPNLGNGNWSLGNFADANRSPDGRNWIIKPRAGYENSLETSFDGRTWGAPAEGVQTADILNVMPPLQGTVRSNEVVDNIPADPESGIYTIHSGKKLYEIITTSKKPVLIKFEAEWCGPCKRMEPVIKRMEKDYVILIVDTEKNPDIRNAYGVETIPYFVSLRDGKILSRIEGATTEQTLRSSFGKEEPPTISSVTPPPPK